MPNSLHGQSTALARSGQVNARYCSGQDPKQTGISQGKTWTISVSPKTQLYPCRTLQNAPDTDTVYGRAH